MGTFSHDTAGEGSGFWQRVSDPAVIGEVQGWFNVVGGAWPLLSLRTFEAIFGPKADPVARVHRRWTPRHQRCLPDHRCATR
jgi:hypothetical protein